MTILYRVREVTHTNTNVSNGVVGCLQDEGGVLRVTTKWAKS